MNEYGTYSVTITILQYSNTPIVNHHGDDCAASMVVVLVVVDVDVVE